MLSSRKLSLPLAAAVILAPVAVTATAGTTAAATISAASSVPPSASATASASSLSGTGGPLSVQTLGVAAALLIVVSGMGALALVLRRGGAA